MKHTTTAGITLPCEDVVPPSLVQTACALIDDNAEYASQRFFAAMAALHPDIPGRLRHFLTRLEPSGVRPLYGHHLTLVWRSHPARLARIAANGQVWTDIRLARMPQADIIRLAHYYVSDLADQLQLKVDCTGGGNVWYLRTAYGDAPHIRDLRDRLDIWAGAIERLTASLQRMYPEPG